MKRVLGLIALTAVIGFTFAACGDADEDSGSSGSLGAALVISNASVVTREWDYETGEEVDFPFDGTVEGLNYVYGSGDNGNKLPLDEAFSGTNTVTLIDGKLSINMGIPKEVLLLSVEMFKEISPDFIISDNTAKFYQLYSIYDEYGNKSIYTPDGVSYWYVDKNVNIGGPFIQWRESDGKMQTIVLTLDLKTGWNTVIQTITKETETAIEGTMKTGKPTGNEKWRYRD
jgi:hypothetical protein